MKYHIIDMGNIHPESTALIDRSFTAWKDVYKQELENRNLKLNEDHFWNCRILAVLEEDTKIVGTHIYNSFNINTLTRSSHKYLQDIPSSHIEIFKEHGVNTLMSMEYLMVNPEYRKNKSSIKWVEIIVGLGFNVMMHSPWDAIVGIAREDKGVSKLAEPMGGQEMDFLVKNETPCRIVYMPKWKYHPHVNLETRNLISTLWRNKINLAPTIVKEDISISEIAA